MYHVSAQGVDERMRNVHYYYYYGLWYVGWFACLISLGLSGLAWFGLVWLCHCHANILTSTGHENDTAQPKHR